MRPLDTPTDVRQPAEGTADRNGTAKPTEAAHNDSEPSTAERAEQMMDHLGSKVGEFTAKVGFSLLQFGARAVEVAQDVWAEAQSIRRGDHLRKETEGKKSEESGK